MELRRPRRRLTDGAPHVDELRDFSRETNAVSSATGPHCQGVVALMDNRSEDGGTVLVPGFHAVFDRWRDALGDPTRYADAHEDW